MFWWTDCRTQKAPAVIVGSTVGVGCYQQLDGQFVSLPPASLPPFSSSSSSVLKSINWAPPALLPTSPRSCSSLLCLHTEGFLWASWALNKHTLPSSYCQQVIVVACPTPCILKSIANTQQFVFCVLSVLGFCLCLFFCLSLPVR